jgi:CheY-like chemotaxis protein
MVEDRYRVLVIEQDEATRTVLATVLADAGYEVQSYRAAGAALEALTGWRPDLVVQSLVRPAAGWSIFRAGQRPLEVAPDTPVLIVSANLDRHAGRLTAPPSRLPKLPDLDGLLEALRKLMQPQQSEP